MTVLFSLVIGNISCCVSGNGDLQLRGREMLYFVKDHIISEDRGMFLKRMKTQLKALDITILYLETWSLLVKWLWTRQWKIRKSGSGVVGFRALFHRQDTDKDKNLRVYVNTGLGLSLLWLLTRSGVSLLPRDMIFQWYFYFIDLTWSSAEWDGKLHLKDEWGKISTGCVAS